MYFQLFRIDSADRSGLARKTTMHHSGKTCAKNDNVLLRKSHLLCLNRKPFIARSCKHLSRFASCSALVDPNTIISSAMFFTPSSPSLKCSLECVLKYLLCCICTVVQPFIALQIHLSTKGCNVTRLFMKCCYTFGDKLQANSYSCNRQTITMCLHLHILL